jgi:exodeoxyribonuclease VII small subunit
LLKKEQLATIMTEDLLSSSANDAPSYAQAFARLEQIAQDLSQHALVDIDQLLPLVDEAMSAYQFCQARIVAVETLLTEKLNTLD